MSRDLKQFFAALSVFFINVWFWPYIFHIYNLGPGNGNWYTFSVAVTAILITFVTIGAAANIPFKDGEN